jgi:hypothetical protein
MLTGQPILANGKETSKDYFYYRDDFGSGILKQRIRSFGGISNLDWNKYVGFNLEALWDKDSSEETKRNAAAVYSYCVSADPFILAITKGGRPALPSLQF